MIGPLLDQWSVHDRINDHKLFNSRWQAKWLICQPLVEFLRLNFGPTSAKVSRSKLEPPTSRGSNIINWKSSKTKVGNLNDIKTSESCNWASKFTRWNFQSLYQFCQLAQTNKTRTKKAVEASSALLQVRWPMTVRSKFQQRVAFSWQAATGQMAKSTSKNTLQT